MIAKCLLSSKFLQGALSNRIDYIRRFTTLILLLLLVIVVNKPVYALGVVINEFDIHASPQVVELLNTQEDTIDISGWYLDDFGGSSFVTIPTLSPLRHNTCLVLTGQFYLNSTTPDTVRLFDNFAPPTDVTSHLIDAYEYTQYGTTDQSHARIPDGSGIFTLSTKSIGKFNVSGADCQTTNISLTATLSPLPVPTSTPSVSASPSPTISEVISITPTLTIITPTPTFTPTSIQTPQKIYISEVMVSPITGNEWIELYNDDNQTVELISWQIDDVIDGGSSPVTFDLTIIAKGYGVVDIPKSLLNDTGDTVRLIDNNNHEVEAFIYALSEKGIPWGRNDIDNNLLCLQSPSKGLANNPCLPSPTNPPSLTPTPSITPVPTLASIPRNVYLSELYVNTNPNEHEWIELYNDNSFAAILQNWLIRDATNQTIASINQTIDPYHYVVIDLTSDKMNNTNETISLINNQNSHVDSFTYSNSEKGISWGRSNSNFGLWCLENPSRGSYNSACIPNPTQTPSVTNEPTSTHVPTRTKTPTPTTRLSVANSQSSSVLGSNTTRTGTSIGNSVEIIDFTPNVNVINKLTPTITNISTDELPEVNNENNPNKIQLGGLIFLINLCMIVAGYQIAVIWQIFKKLYP